MDIKLVCRKEHIAQYTALLEKAGFTITEQANLTFREDDFIAESFLGKSEAGVTVIPYQEVVSIEAFGSEVLLHTIDHQYEIKERLYEVIGLYEDRGFIRINKSQIINKAMIRQIRPQLNSKFTLLMKNNQLVDVTRSYLVTFKEIMGL